MKHHLLTLFFVLLGSTALTLHAEVIRQYDVHVDVRANGDIRVTETIRATVEHQDIRRGIFRDLPTKYPTRWGGTIRVPLEVESVRRNGDPEPYALESAGTNGQRIRIGDPDTLLSKEEHEWEIVYTAGLQVGFFEEFDEIYWNAIGNGWKFVIEQASARVSLPGAVSGDQLRVDAYTGHEGAKGQDFDLRWRNNLPVFHVTRALHPGEGLTIAVGFPKGIIQEPTRWERWMNAIRYQPSVLSAFIGVILLLAYLLVIWFQRGRDPEAGTLIPRFHPPEGVSAAGARYLWKMGYDNECFAAALIALASKGQVDIRVEKDTYTLERKTHPADDLSAGERSVLRHLFRGKKEIVLKQSNHTRIKAAVEGLKEALKKEHLKKHFITNRLWLLPAVGMAVLNLVLGAVMSGRAEAIFFSVWLSFWSLGVVMLVTQVVSAWRQVVNGSLIGIFPALFITAFSVPFLLGEAMGLYMLANAISWIAAALYLGQIPILWVFHRLFKQPTVLGRELMDALEGFRQYLDTAEKELLHTMHPPTLTPELFERYLPYALALDVEQAWAEKFETSLKEAGRTPHTSTHRGYRPGWYHGHSSFNTAALVGAMGGALASAVASSSTAPGSSSGGGGGGSSGGGGGGGGGGGW